MKKHVLIIFLFLSTQLIAQDYWTQLNGPFGGSVVDLVVHSSGAAVAATSGNGIWRSTDQGGTWTKLTTGSDVFFTDLDVDPSGNIYATAFNRIYKSTDGGASFPNLNSTGIATSIRRIKAASSTKIYLALSNNNIFKSTNSGATFNIASSDITTQVNDLDVNPANTEIVYVSTQGQGVKVSEDGGLNFNVAISGSITSSEAVYSLVVNSAGVAFALTSSGPHMKAITSGSNVWASIKGTIPDASFFGQLAFDASENLYLANTNTRKVYSGNTLGTVWNAGTSYPAHITSTSLLVISASNWLMSSNPGGVFKTTNSGAAWTDANGGFKSLSPSQIFVPPTPSRIFVAYGLSGGNGYLQSNDDGSTWINQSASPVDRSINGFVKLADNSVIAYGYNGVIRSTGTIGNSWTSQNTTNSLTQVVTYDGVNLFSFANQNLLKSTDQGVTWVPTAITGLTGSINKIQVDAANNIYARTNNAILYKILNGASTATSIRSSVFNDFSVTANATTTVVYALNNTTQLDVSSDAGATWTSKSINSTFSATKIWAYRNNIVVTGSSASNSFNTSKDNGSTWTNNAFLESTARIADVTLNSSEVAYVATTNSTAYKTISTIIPPVAPTGLTVLGFDNNSADVMWNDNSNNESTYLLEVSKGNNTSYETHSDFAYSTNFQGRLRRLIRASLASGTINYIRVSAKNGAGQSAYSNEVSVTTLSSSCAASIPGNRSWNSVTVADSGFPTNGVGPFIGTNHLIESFGNNAYYVQDYANNIVPTSPSPAWFQYNGLEFEELCGSTVVTNFGSSTQGDLPNGNGTWNAATKTLTLKWQASFNFQPFKATTTYTLNATDPIPATPQLKTFIYSSTEVFLNWSTTAFETQYKVYRSSVSNGTFLPVATVNFPTVTYIDKNLTPGSTYYYKISALNTSGESALSSELAVAVGATLFRPVENSIQLNFDVEQGGSWGDMDGDGDEDLITPSFQNQNGANTPPKAYENKGNGVFDVKSITALNNLTLAITRGISIFDFNNDGKLDLYLGRSFENDVLLVNNGNWDFTATLIANTNGTDNQWKSPSLLDIEKDGFVDIFLGKGSSSGNIGATLSTFKALVLKNNAGANFTELATGTLVTNQNDTRSASAVDYDNDGDQDIFVATLNVVSPTPTEPPHLYNNNGDGTFTRITGSGFDTELLPAIRTSSWGDIDNDGDLDLYLGSQNTNPTGSIVDYLYRNNGNGTFTSLTSSAAAESGTVTFGSMFGDIENDGDLDLIVVNSFSNSIFINNGSGTFTKYTTIQELIVHPDIAEIGGSMADFDKDGFLDVYLGKGSTTAINIPAILYENTNTPSASKNWLEVKLAGTVSNKSAIGARIKAITTTPARTQIREIMSLTGYGGQSSLIQHFGLGTATTVSSLEVRWPNGKVQTFSNVAANQLLTITEDATGPVAALSPAPGASNVSSGTALKLALNEPATRVAGKYVSLYKSSDLVNYVYRVEATALVVVGNEYTFTMPAKLEGGAAYEVTADAGAFVDAAQNSSLAILSGNWTFTVGTGPSVLSLSPVNSGVSINTNSKIEITFSGATTAVATKKIDVYKVGTPPTLFTSFTADQGVVAGNKVSFSPPSKLNLNTQYYVTIEPGAFVDDVQNDFAGIAAAAWQFTTSAGPEVDVVTPANSATNVPVNANLEVTFKQPITAVAGKKLQIKDGATVILDVDVSATGVISGNKYTLDPATDFPFLKVLEVIIQPGAFIDIGQNDFKGIPTGQWTFTTIEAADVTAPAISFDPVEFNKLEKGFAPKTLAISASDNKAVTSAVMYYRKISEKDYTKLPLVLNAVSGKWETSVASTFADEMGFEYYLRARDAAGNKGRLPADSTRFTSRVTLTAANRPQLDLPGGASQNSWRVIAVPYELANSQIETVLNSLGSANKTKWKMIRLTANPQPNGAWVEFPASGFTDIERGKGYFINTKDAIKITLTDPVSPSNSRDNLYTISLVKGWNQIGNPYTTPIKWSEAIAYNNATGNVGALKTFTGGTYVAGDELTVGQGGFVNVQTDVSNFKIPFKGQTVTGGRVGAPTMTSTELSELNWRMPIALRQQGITNELGAIGMSPEASVSFDEHDDATPPRFFDYLELSFDHPEHFTKRFSRDVVPTQKEFTWEFSVNSNLEGPAELTWDNTLFGENEKELFLLDVQNQGLVNMREVNRFAFNPAEFSKFKLFFGTNLKAKITPATVVLGKAYPNPTTGMTTISFALPDQATGYQVNLDVYDNLGRKINTIINGSFKPGFYNSEWDASVGSLSNGIYTYRLAVSSSTGSEVQSGKIVIKK